MQTKHDTACIRSGETFTSSLYQLQIFIHLFVCRNEYLARVSESFICLKKMDVIVNPFLLYHTVLYTNMPCPATMQFTDARYIKAKPP